MIQQFEGEHRFLSNFWPAKVVLDGEIYYSVEHAYQAAKTEDVVVRAMIRNAPTAAQAKKTAKRLIKSLDKKYWDTCKEEVMMFFLQQKFSHGSELCDKLLATGDEKLVEGNWWGDVYWGVCNGVGENRLGVLLMQVRDERREEYGLQLIAHGK